MLLKCGTYTYKCPKASIKNVFYRQWDHALLEQFNLPNLVNRYVHLKLCTHGLLYFPSHVVTPDVHSGRHHVYPLPLLHCLYARTTAFQSSFVPSSISVWNHLPSEASHALLYVP